MFCFVYDESSKFLDMVSCRPNRSDNPRQARHEENSGDMGDIKELKEKESVLLCAYCRDDL